eukprot:TRINITY_DN7916_c0_g1_i1.p2 TRINITY_DN7916_c0_g1~~TRINITY_DN7916_c0_g1_i1.p2  ORF type:complete len:123 (-),score=64.79 TRINITY_DN7916_c0_g1_i1:366-734(-)
MLRSLVGSEMCIRDRECAMDSVKVAGECAKMQSELVALQQRLRAVQQQIGGEQDRKAKLSVQEAEYCGKVSEAEVRSDKAAEMALDMNQELDSVMDQKDELEEKKEQLEQERDRLMEEAARG